MNDTAMSSSYHAELSRHLHDANDAPIWPAASWDVVVKMGALRWSIPKEYGGDGLGGADILARYESLAAACVTTCFLLSQRDAACRRLRGSGKPAIDALFPGLVSGELFATVGLAQLTTSRQHTRPAMLARLENDMYVVNGLLPWVSGAAHADYIVFGAALEDGKQILGVMEKNQEGIKVGAPLPLAALVGSITAEVRCENVRVGKEWILAGPTDNVMQGERGGTGGLETSSLALGLAAAASGYLFDQASLRPELGEPAQRIGAACGKLRKEMWEIARGATSEQAQQIRAKANALVLRATQSALAVSKGTGFLLTHPAQAWARQALFFLVWSCPWPVTASTLEMLNRCEEDVS